MTGINAGELIISLRGDDSLLLQDIQKAAKKAASEIGSALSQGSSQSKQAQQQVNKQLQETVSLSQRLAGTERESLKIAQEQAQANAKLKQQIERELAYENYKAGIQKISRELTYKELEAEVQLLKLKRDQSAQERVTLAEKQKQLSELREELTLEKQLLEINAKAAKLLKPLEAANGKGSNISALSGFSDSEVTSKLRKISQLSQLKIDEEFKQAREEAERLENAVKGVDKTVGGVNKEIRNTESIFTNIQEAITHRLTNALLSLPGHLVRALTSAMRAINAEISRSLDAFKQFEALEASINIVYGGEEAGGKALSFLEAAADKYRYSILDLADSYKGLAAAMLSAGKTQQEVNYIFEGFLATGRALGMTNQQLELSLKAVEQIFSKQKITLEELRGQLGDSMPIAIGALAKSLNVSTEALLELIKAGLSGDALFDMVRHLREEYGGKLPEALKTTLAVQERLNNEVFKLRKDFGEAINPFNQAAMEAAGTLLQSISREVFANLNNKAEEFKAYLEANPKIVKQIAREINDLLNRGLNYIADKAGELLKYLKENPKAIERAITKAGDFAKDLGALVKLAQDLARWLGKGMENAGQITANLVDRPDGNAGPRGELPEYRTGTAPGQLYGVARPGGRRHAGVDFDISGDDAEAVSFLGGRITRIGNDPGGYGNYIDIFNAQRGVIERIAEVAEVLVREGQNITAGTAVGRGETDTGVFHYEIRRPDQSTQYGPAGGYGFEGTQDPLAYYARAGLTNNIQSNSVSGSHITVIPNIARPAQTGLNRLVEALDPRNAPAGPPVPEGYAQVDINTLRDAIMGQESGGDHRAVNTRTGAMGLYQLLPENVTRWSRQVLGREVSHNEFLNNPQLQTQIVNGIMQGMLSTAMRASNGNAELAIRRVASEWYSGDQSLFDNARPQGPRGDEPSIREYTTSILSRYRGIAANQGRSSVGSSTYLTSDPGTTALDDLPTGPSEQDLEKQRRELQSLQNEALRAQRQREDLFIQGQRAERDTRLANLAAQAAENAGLQSLIKLLQERNSISDRYQNQITEYSRTIADLKVKNEELANSPLESEENAGARDAAIAANNQLIQQLEQQKAAVESLRRTELDSLQQRTQATLQLAETQRQLEMTLYRMENDAQRRELTDALAIAQAPNSYEADLLGIDSSITGIQEQIDSQVAEYRQGKDALVQARDEFLQSLGNLSPEEIQALGGIDADTLISLNNQIADFDEKIADTLNNGNLQIEIQLIERQQILDEQNKRIQEALTQSLDKLAELRANQTEQEYGVWVANDERRINAEAQIRRSLELQIQQYKEAGVLTEELESNLRAIATIEITNLADQFKTLWDTISEMMDGSFKQFFQSLITGSQSAGEAFRSLIGNILSQLAQLAINQIWVDLFGGGGIGSIFGGSSSPAPGSTGLFGAVGNVIGAMAGIDIPMFANGGLVDRPTLAMIGEGAYSEAIVPLPNGRSIPVDLRGAGAISGNGINSTVNVSINADGSSKVTGDGGATLGRRIEQAVRAVLVQEKRPGGLLN